MPATTTSRCWSRPPASWGSTSRASRTEFDLPLGPVGTDFQLARLGRPADDPLRRRPGRTASSPRAIGKGPLASRAVGLANGANPISIVVPCHRVIGADGSLTGFGGGLERKRYLLELEQPSLFSG